MRKELEHFYIGNSYGGNQDWFRTFMMRIGGCGAETACESSLYFALHKGIEGIYPFDTARLTKEDYVEFAHMMERYLWPRMTGINKLSIYIDGYSKYLKEHKLDSIRMTGFSGSEPYEKAVATLIAQIDAGYPVPMLILNHREPMLKDYVWHWFIINGYDLDEEGGAVSVKTVNYSRYSWFDFHTMWESGHDHKGGLVLYDIKK